MPKWQYIHSGMTFELGFFEGEQMIKLTWSNRAI
jgi:hypothetical protein